MDQTEKQGSYHRLDEADPFRMKANRFPIAVRVADMPDDLGTLLEKGLKEYFHGR